MKLRRNRQLGYILPLLAVGAGFTAGALLGFEFVVYGIDLGPFSFLLLGLIFIGIGVAVGVRAFGRAPLTLDEIGMTLRTSGVKRTLSWSEVDIVVLEPGGVAAGESDRVVLVPAAGVDLGVPLDYRNKADRRPSLVLVKLDNVQSSVAEVGQALKRYAGPRFVDKTVVQRVSPTGS